MTTQHGTKLCIHCAYLLGEPTSWRSAQVCTNPRNTDIDLVNGATVYLRTPTGCRAAWCGYDACGFVAKNAERPTPPPFREDRGFFSWLRAKGHR